LLDIKVLGPGCAECDRLEQNVKEAVAMLGEQAAVEKVQDFQHILSFGVMQTPALVVNGKVVAYGRVPTTGEVMTMITTRLAQAEEESRGGGPAR